MLGMLFDFSADILNAFARFQ